MWSDEAAPRRIEPQALVKTAVAPADRFLALSVPGLRRAEAPQLRVVAAPAEMWADVPEDLLPNFPLREDGTARLPIDSSRPWRLRLVGAGRGSAWIDLPAGSRASTLFAEPADALDLTVVSSTGSPARGVGVSVLAARDSAGVMARFVGDDGGRLVVPGLPPSTPLTLVLSLPDHAPLLLAGTPAQLPKKVVLDAGERLRGRVLHASVGGPPVPVSGASVTVEAWLANDAGALYRKTATTSEQGTWEIVGVPARSAMVEIRSPHLVPWSRRLELGEDGVETAGTPGLNLGDVILQRGVNLQVAVVDDLGRPVAGARVQAGPPTAGPPSAVPSPAGPVAGRGAGGSTDVRGQVQLDALIQDEPVVVRAAATGHVAAVERLLPPLPERTVVAMVRAYQVTGRLVDGDGVAVVDGSVRVKRGSAFHDQPLDPGGTFTVELPPETPAELTFTSPGSAALAVSVGAGSAGEVRDLGEIRAPKGLTVTGQLLARLDGTPVAGARVWVPRRMEGGPLVAWMLGKVNETSSDVEGRFALGGLDAVPDLIRIDAPGKARLYLPVQPKPETTWLDAGELWLDEGAALRVSVPEEDGHEEGQVRVDLRNRGLEIDMVTAPIHEGAALVEHLPPNQELTVSAVRGPRLVCEQRVDLPDNGETADVDCDDDGVEVTGTVLAGGKPVTGGQLVWATKPPEEGAIIINSASSLGLRRETVAGAGRPPVFVEVDGEGRFATHDLAAGSWLVSWNPAGGGTAPEMAVEVPVRKNFDVTLEIPGRTVQGVVLDAQDQPAARARVRELGSGDTTLSAPDGTFSLTGLQTDTVQLEARQDELRSAVATVEISTGQKAPWVELRLDKGHDDQLIVQVLGPGGEPKGGAFVLIEDDLHNLRLLTTDNDGRAKASMPPPLPRASGSPRWPRESGRSAPGRIGTRVGPSWRSRSATPGPPSSPAKRAKAARPSRDPSAGT